MVACAATRGAASQAVAARRNRFMAAADAARVPKTVGGLYVQWHCQCHSCCADAVFAQDRLQASDQQTAVFLVLYFVCAAASMPLWLRMVRRWGLAWSWLLGMLLAVLCFSWTAGLQAGQQQALP